MDIALPQIPYCHPTFGVLGVVLAIIVILKIVGEILKEFWLYVLPRIGPQPNLKSTYGKWAVVTGGSDGIGKGYAKELAKKGMNICIFSNFENGIVAEIKKLYDVECRWINVDFSSTDVFKEIETELSTLDDIGILVNNVGMVQHKMQPIAEQNMDFFMKIIHVNMISTVMMTSLVLPGMIRKNKGLIVNMGSISSVLPLPYAAIYSSTKSFVETYSICLAAELNETNVRIKCIQPWFVNTQLLKGFSCVSSWMGSYVGWSFPDSETFSRSAAATFGYPTPLLYNGYWTHSLIQFLLPHGLLGKPFTADLCKLFARRITKEI